MPSISDLMKEIKGGIAAEDSKIKQVQAEVLVGLGEDKPESIQGFVMLWELSKPTSNKSRFHIRLSR